MLAAAAAGGCDAGIVVYFGHTIEARPPAMKHFASCALDGMSLQ